MGEVPFWSGLRFDCDIRGHSHDIRAIAIDPTKVTLRRAGWAGRGLEDQRWTECLFLGLRPRERLSPWCGLSPYCTTKKGVPVQSPVLGLSPAFPLPGPRPLDLRLGGRRWMPRGAAGLPKAWAGGRGFRCCCERRCRDVARGVGWHLLKEEVNITRPKWPRSRRKKGMEALMLLCRSVAPM